MSSELIDIGLSALERTDAQISSEDFALELVKRALAYRKSANGLPVRIGLLLATAEWAKPSQQLPRHVRTALRSRVGYDVPLLGGSMASLYSWRNGEGGFIERGVILILFCSQHLRATVGCTSRPYVGCKPNLEELAALADDLEGRGQPRLGASADRYLFGILPGFRRDAQGNRCYYDNELYFAVLEAFGYRYYLYGAAAADKMAVPETGFQFADDKVLESGLALAFMESDLRAVTRMRGAFVPTERVVRVDRLVDGAESGYEIEQLDGEPAAARIQELVTEDRSGAGRVVLGLRRTGEDYSIVLPLSQASTGSVRVNRKIVRGDNLRVMFPSRDRPSEIMGATIGEALKSVDGSPSDLVLVLGFACTRLRQLREAQGVEVRDAGKWFQEHYPGIPVVGAYCAGEFAMDRWRGARPSNLAVWVRCYLNQLWRHSAARVLQEELAEASAALLTCHSPREVMRVALEGANQAGATGGQICILDRRLGRILGREYGFALNKPGAEEDWRAVAELSDRSAPEAEGGEFPAELENYAMPVVPDTWAGLSRSASTREEDILTLITRTLRAVFVPDSRDPRFRCNQEAVRIGKTRAQLAVPLVGSERKVIGTLQLGFPDGRVLDRERFGLWVSYAQKVAATLEREQEAEARKLAQSLADQVNLILARPIDVEGDPYDWCEAYVEEVKDLLRARSVHIRVRRRGLADDEFFLAASVGDGNLPELRKKFRPVTRATEMGSCMTGIPDDGVVSKNAKEAERLLVGKGLERENALIKALAWLPLTYQRERLGSLVIDHDNERFFTESRTQLARTAAGFAATILRARKESFDRAVFDRCRTELVEETTGKILAASDHGQYKKILRAALESLGKAMGAESSSLFVWHNLPAKLLLYAAWNWREPQEDEAFYDRDEGWTGRLVGAEKGVAVVTPYSPQFAFVTNKYLAKIDPSWNEGTNPAQVVRIGSRLELDRVVGAVAFGCRADNPRAARLTEEATKALILLGARTFASVVKTILERGETDLHERLHRTEEETARLLIDALDPGDSWQPVLDTVRDGFQVERLTLYVTEEDRSKVRRAWNASSRAWGPPQETVAVAEYETLAKMLRDGEPLLVGGPDDFRLAKWHDTEGVRTLSAVPTLSAEGRISGLLEFVNRKPSLDHPYEFFNGFEERQARDVARLFGIALGYRDYRERLDRLQSELATATRIGAAGVFGGMVLHDLMGPFERIQRAVDLLRAFPERDRNNYYQQIEAQTQRAARMVEEAANRNFPARRAESLRTLVREAVAVIEATMPSQWTNLVVSNDLLVTIQIDLPAVVEALVNVMSNAIDAMAGQGTLTVSTALSADQTKAIIRIHNTGPFLTDEVKDRMFLVGFSTKPGAHAGLGLALARHAIQAASGDITARNADEGGVEFIISLPICRGENVGDGIWER
jgi:signal transduction histidine kinase